MSFLSSHCCEFLYIQEQHQSNFLTSGTDMARKRKTGGFEDGMDLVAKLPWWAGVALALISYVFLHQLAQPPSGKALQAGHFAEFAARSMVSTFASIGQFLVPAICLFGALGSFLAGRRRQALVNNVSQSKSADALDGMSWHEFELLVSEAFRLQGFRVAELGGSGPDGGIDLVLTKGTEKFLVQCKQWKAFKVSVTVVRELYGVMAAKGAAGGFVVTSGRFTEDATAFASGRNIKLIDGPQLHGLIRQAQNPRGASAAPRGNLDLAAPVLAPKPTPQPISMQSATPQCPSCGSMMTKRKAKRGVNAGDEFWGCATYPACKGTRSI
jgi:restriction system protein